MRLESELQKYSCAENWSFRAPRQVLKGDEHVDIRPLLTVENFWSKYSHRLML